MVKGPDQVDGATPVPAEVRTRTERPIRRRLVPADPLVPAVAAVSLVVYVLHGFNGYLGKDLGLYVYAGQRFAEGVPPYEGVLNRAGPLAHMLPGVAIAAGRVVGIGDVLSARLLFCAFSVAATCVAYLFGRNLFGSRWSGLVTAATMLSFGGFLHYATTGPREKTAMVLFVWWALWAVQQKRWMTAGVFVSLATLTWQPSFIVGVAAVGVAALLQPDRLRSLVRFVLGGVITTAIFSLYFVLVGAFKDFLDGFILINAEYTESVPFTDHPKTLMRSLEQSYGLSLWLVPFGLAALIVIGLLAVLNERRRAAGSMPIVVALAAAAACGTAWTLHDINGWPDIFVLLPFAAVGVGGAVHEIVRRVSLRAALAVSLTWVLVATTFATIFSIDRTDDILDDQRTSVRTLLANLPPGADILSIQAPQALVLSGQTNPTRIQMLRVGFAQYVDDTWPGGLKGLGAWISRQNPTVIALSGRRPHWLESTLANYQAVGHVPSWTWYVKSSVGQETLSTLRDKLRLNLEGHIPDA